MSDPPGPFTDRLRLAVAAYPARFKGSSREHTLAVVFPNSWLRRSKPEPGCLDGA